jgi:hypothetical protein
MLQMWTTTSTYCSHSVYPFPQLPPRAAGRVARVSAVGGARAATLLLSVRARRTAACPLHHTSRGPPPPRYARGRKNKIVLAAHSRPFPRVRGEGRDEGALPLGSEQWRNPSLGLVRNPTSPSRYPSRSRHCEERQRRSNPASAQAALDCFADARNDANVKSFSRRALHPAPRSGEGGPPCESRAVEGATASRLASAPHAPSTALTRGPPPPLRFTTRGRTNKIVLATLSCARVVPTTTTRKKICFPKSKREAERRKADAIHVRAAQTSARNLRQSSATRLRALSGHARLSALTFAALATGYYPDGSAPRTGFPEGGPC